MTRSDIDWRYFRQGLVLPFLLAAGGLMLFGLSAWQSGGAGMRLNSEEQYLADLDQQRSELATRLEARARYAAKFARLREAGVAAPGQRLAWTQALRDSATELGLPYLRYAAMPEQRLPVPGPEAPSEVSVALTPVELEVGLLHELDLLRLVGRLQSAPGLLDVAGCSLRRTGESLAPAADQATLEASCQLRWFTIPPPGGLLMAESAP
ncbi:MAG: hypothetical protein L6Q83_09945 [Gammaproteobacteria bacterium]|nr:hypothetical protein [Gammaproteobacteria bacterium]